MYLIIHFFHSNIYTRRVLSGEFQIVSSFLVAALVRLGLWTDSIRRSVIADRGEATLNVLSSIMISINHVDRFDTKDPGNTAACKGGFQDCLGNQSEDGH